MWDNTNNEFLLGIVFSLEAKDPVDIQIKDATHALDQGDMMGFDKLIIETESSAVCEMLNSSTPADSSNPFLHEYQHTLKFAKCEVEFVRVEKQKNMSVSLLALHSFRNRSKYDVLEKLPDDVKAYM